VTIFVKTVGTMKTLEEGTRFDSLEVPEGSSISEVIARVGLEDWEVGLVLINDTHATKESILKDQDHLTLIAPLVGG
jgi:sulfur carrier protein ThiS